MNATSPPAQNPRPAPVTITAEMASSLMNDTRYLAEMYDLMIKAAGIMYSLTRQYRGEMTDLPDDAGEISADERRRISEMLRQSQKDIDDAIERARLSE